MRVIQVHMYVDTREKVTARYQVMKLILKCLSSLLLGHKRKRLSGFYTFFLLNPADLPIQKRSDGFWKLKTEWNTST